MSKNKTFIGRGQELQQLYCLTQKKTASFVVIKGRRPIGKSRLIDEFSNSFDNYYKFEGLAPGPSTTPEDQLEEFCIQMSREFKTAKARYDNWSDALWAVGERVQSGKTLLFFDEISWMGSKTKTFLSKIKIFWDDLLKKNNQLIFVVCSSASSWIEKNLLSSTGFVGRVSLTLTVNELLSHKQNKQQYGRITEYLWELEEIGFVSRDYTWNIKTGSNLNLSKYRLKDNYLRFNLKYIKKNLDKIKRGHFDFKSLESLPLWHTIIGLQFENLVINNKKVLYKALEILPIEIINANPFFQHKKSRANGCQIDYMIQTKANCLYVCKIK